MAAGKDKLKSSLSSSASCPILSKAVNYCSLVSYSFKQVLSFPLLTYFIFDVFISLLKLSFSENSNLGLGICRCLSLYITNFVLKRKVGRGIDLSMLVPVTK